MPKQSASHRSRSLDFGYQPAAWQRTHDKQPLHLVRRRSQHSSNARCVPPHRVSLDPFKDDWSINRIRNWDADGNRLMHIIDNIELVLSGLNPSEPKGATTTFTAALLSSIF